MFIYIIYLCCYVSSRRPSDIGSTMNNCIALYYGTKVGVEY